MPRSTHAATGDPVLLNEFLVSHTGTDTTEFVELYGVPGTPLSGLSLVFVEGDGAAAGIVDRRVDFPAGARLGGNGYYLVGNPAGLGTNYHVVPDLALGTDALENGSQTVALVEAAGLGDAGTVVTGSETVRDAVGLTDAGASDHWFWNAPVIGPDDGFLPGGARRVTNGVDTDSVTDWAFADDQLGPSNTPTPATPYNAPPAADCGPGVMTDEGVAAGATLTATDPDGRVVDFSASSVPDPGTLAVSAVVVSPSAGQAASATLDVTATTAPGSYVVTVTATNDDATPQQATCTLSVTVNDVADPMPEPTPAPTPVPLPPPTASTAALWAMVNGLLDGHRMAGDKGHLLTDRVERVDRFLAGGQLSAALAQLQAFANQVQGLSPRWLSADAANALVQVSVALRSALRP
ncbi:MAG TPA: cadherin repeat domain-containing protein [Candidatus Limnocylindria bacterium]|nr:cadherin repeat domain-containing protein [Candidatus Limnocylindria bacterium]